MCAFVYLFLKKKEMMLEQLNIQCKKINEDTVLISFTKLTQNGSYT